MKPFSQACANNAPHIARHLKALLEDDACVLEIGSGTGQHAVYFAESLPKIIWQASDVSQNISGINQWIIDATLPNALPPIELDINQSLGLDQRFDVIFMANTLHIMPWPTVELCIHKIPQLIKDRSLLIIYGPFKYQGAYTSHSNEQFDRLLKTRNSEQGIRDFEVINRLLTSTGFNLEHDYPMPANNRLLVWSFKR